MLRHCKKAVNLLNGSLVRTTVGFSPLPCLEATTPAYNLVQKRFRAGPFNAHSADQLWKAQTSVSNQGRQRGRAKGLTRFKNLNRGQKLGFGKARIAWPGLTTNVLDPERKKAEIGELSTEEFKKYEESVQEVRSMFGTRKGLRKRQTPLERGWTSASPQGRKFGPPLAPNPELQPTFDSFDSTLIEYKIVTNMTGKYGRVRKVSLLMVTGNRNGVAGFALSKTPTGRGGHMYKKAVNKAGLKLMMINRYEDRTVYHDFFTQFGQTRLMVKQAPPFHGIVGHRVVKAICELVGIKDLEVILEGSHNVNHICKAFFLGLLRQKSHQAMANNKQLHLVEFREENDNFPRLVASPEDGKVRTKDEILPNEILDFESISFDGQMPHYYPPKVPFYVGEKSWVRTQWRNAPYRHIREQTIELMATKGDVVSHLYPKYPECRKYYGREDRQQEEID